MKCKFLQYITLYKGYSTTELLASITIASVLMGIVVPNYNRIRFEADETKAVVNLNSMYMAQKEYRVDQGTYATEEKKLQTYVDFSTNDDSWQYQINSAGANDFVIQANNQNIAVRWMQIDETGTITRNY